MQCLSHLNLDYAAAVTRRERWDLNFDFYWRPWSHIGPYCIGMGLGYLMATTPVLVLRPRARLAAWTASLSTLFGVLFGVYFWNNGMETSALLNAFYSSTHRTVWACGLAWLVYACISGQGGWINAFLSWKGFIPMSRLTFMVYLAHPWLIWLYMANARHLVDTTHYTGVRLHDESEGEREKPVPPAVIRRPYA